jgi:hypothetical protein
MLQEIWILYRDNAPHELRARCLLFCSTAALCQNFTDGINHWPDWRLCKRICSCMEDPGLLGATLFRTASSSRQPTIVQVVKSRRMRWAGHVARMGEYRGVHRVLVGIPEGKRPLGRPRRWWEDNIKMDLQDVGGVLGDWMELAQDRDRWRVLVRTVRNFRVP